LTALLAAGLTPVFAPLTHDGKGSMLNTNADTIAAVLATALAQQYEVHLVYCFEKKGVLRDVNDDASVIPAISETEYIRLKEDGVVAAGMIPKLDNAMQALRSGVKYVHVGQADDLAELIQENASAGTTLYLSAAQNNPNTPFKL
jgi:acetylglutamate kinase